MKNNPKNNYDVAIIGAGLTGMTMACSLASEGVSVVIIESADLKQINAKESDGRTCAISGGSAKIFEGMGVWSDMAAQAGPILDIRVTDGDSPLFLHYDHQLVGEAPMGYIVENYHIRKALFAKAESLSDLTIIDGTKYTSIERGAGQAVIELESGKKITTSLVIAADGKNSGIRQQAEIRTTEWNYKQCGIVCTVEHTESHHGVAQERFLPAGPFAILPMKNLHHSSIVWMEKTQTTPIFMKMDDAEFLEHLHVRFNGYLGKLKVVGKRFAYPLGLTLAHKYTCNRLALIGDAAHSMHPIAGQGFNLGIRDVPVLTNLIVNAKNLGFGVGSDSVLAGYEQQRKFDNISLLVVTDGLNCLFSNDILPIKIARRFGMAAVNKIPALKKVFIKHAMGESGIL